MRMQKGFADASHWSPLQPDAAAGASPAAAFPSTGPHGHRKRMRARVIARGAGTLADYEILEMLLFFGIPRGDTKPLAKATINRFGSLAAVVRADRAALLGTPGFTERCADALALVRDSCAALAATEARDAPILSSWAALRAYLASTSPAALRVLYLDNRNRLLADETAPSPALDGAATRAILKRAIECHSVSLLLASWRESPLPTRADRECLLRLRGTAAAVAVGIHDFALVCGGELSSVQQDL
jgi:DNA repair protein RadC